MNCFPIAKPLASQALISSRTSNSINFPLLLAFLSSSSCRLLKNNTENRLLNKQIEPNCFGSYSVKKAKSNSLEDFQESYETTFQTFANTVMSKPISLILNATVCPSFLLCSLLWLSTATKKEQGKIFVTAVFFYPISPRLWRRGRGGVNSEAVLPKKFPPLTDNLRLCCCCST